MKYNNYNYTEMINEIKVKSLTETKQDSDYILAHYIINTKKE